MRTGANLMNWFNTLATKRTLSRVAARLVSRVGAPGRPDATTDAWYCVEAWDGITDDLPEWVRDYRDFELQVATMPVETAVRLSAEYQEHLVAPRVLRGLLAGLSGLPVGRPPVQPRALGRRSRPGQAPPGPGQANPRSLRSSYGPEGTPPNHRYLSPAPPGQAMTAASSSTQHHSPATSLPPHTTNSTSNTATDFKIRRDVTPRHHDPMVIHFARLQRPNRTEESACR